jgi:predicted metal-dependent phosphoesterase TrpH
MLIDLHTHTRPLSWDSLLSPDTLIEAAKKAGLDGICLTEHDFFWDPDAVRELGRKHDFLVIPAIEINTDDGHFLCYGLETYVYGMHRTPELIEHVRSAGGVMIAAHPYRRQMPWNPGRESEYEEALHKARSKSVYAACAAMECVNGRGNEAENGFSSRLCNLLEVPTVATSDAHQYSDVGKCGTEFTNRVEDLGSLIEELKAGRFRPVTANGKTGELSLSTD